MAPVGVPGAAANVVANGGTIYNGLVQTVRKSADYDVLTAEALFLAIALLLIVPAHANLITAIN